MKKKLIIIGTVLLATAIAISVVLIGGNKKAQEPTNEELLAEHGTEVAADAESDAGTVEANTSAETSGEEGSEVSQTDHGTVGPDAVFVKDVLFASHEPDEIVMTVNGQDVTWREYFYWVNYYTSYYQYYMQMYSYYGMTYNWTDAGDEEGTMTVAEGVIKDAEDQLSMMYVIMQFAEENDITLSEEELQELDELIQSDIETNCGEGSTEADFEEFLNDEYLTLELYNKFNRLSYLYQDCFNWLYGENGEKVSDEEALSFLEENGYMRANHILIMTVDPDTGEALSDEEIEEAKKRAEEIALELQSIGDTEVLLQRFAQLKEQYCEDTGKAYYPDGYVFEDGDMVEEFENGCKALAEYEVSDPILSTYGYHIIIRLPHDPDAVVEYSDEGTQITCRKTYANIKYAEKMQTILDTAEIVKADSIKKLDLLDYLIEE